MRWFRALLPREDKFFDLFDAHARLVMDAAVALQNMLSGEDVERYCQEIVTLEQQADRISADVLLAVRKSFITPFDRGDIKDLIQSMDDAIDTMHKTVKTVRLFEQTSFDRLMQEMGAVIVEAARLTGQAVPLLEKAGANANRVSGLTDQITRLEERSDALHEQGLKDLFRRYGSGNAMAYVIGSEIYGGLEKVVDRLEDVADEIAGIVIEHV